MNEPAYVRRYDGYRNSAPGPWVPEPEQARTPWRARVAAANPAARWAFAAGIVLLLTAVIVIAALHAGHAAADSFGPLIPVPAPQPAPYPEGWTP